MKEIYVTMNVETMLFSIKFTLALTKIAKHEQSGYKDEEVIHS